MGEDSGTNSNLKPFSLQHQLTDNILLIKSRSNISGTQMKIATSTF